MNTNGGKLMPTTYLLMSVVAIVALHVLLPVAKVVPTPWNLLGILPLVVGVVINLVADRAFHAAQTTVRPFEKSSALVTSGVFRVSRNPMYLGFVLLLIGLAVLLRSLTPYLVVVAFAALLDRQFVAVEEQMLAEQFGADWQRYRLRTRRWL